MRQLRLEVGDLGVRALERWLEVEGVELVCRVFFVVFCTFLLLRQVVLFFLLFRRGLLVVFLLLAVQLVGCFFVELGLVLRSEGERSALCFSDVGFLGSQESYDFVDEHVLGDLADGPGIVGLGHDGDVFVLRGLDDAIERDEFAVFHLVHRNRHRPEVLHEALVSGLDLGWFVCVT